MNTQSRIIVGLLVAAVAALGIAVGAMAAGSDGDSDGTQNHMDADDPYTGMMGAMGSMDSDNMLEHMREILGQDGYNRMMRHFEDHQKGVMTGDTEVDGMMHLMMDGMTRHMPGDNQDILPSDVE